MNKLFVTLLCFIFGFCGCISNKPDSNSTIQECFMQWGSTNKANNVTSKTYKGKVFIGGLIINTNKTKVMLKAIRVPSNFEAPEIIDNSAYVSYIQDQGQLPECTTRSEAAILDASYWRSKNYKCYTDAHKIYLAANKLDNDGKDGASFESTLDVVKSKSFITSGEIPTINSGILVNTDDLPYVIHKYGFLWVGLNITDSWYTPSYDGKIKSGGGLIGPHAVVVVGYSKPCNLIKILNSWGQFWGDNGYCYLSFEEFENELIYGTTQYIEWK